MWYRILLALSLAGILWLPASVVAQNTTGLTIHVVQPDETLEAVALQVGLSASELAQINGLPAQAVLTVGQTLLVPVAGAAQQAQTHVVQPGESVTSIAAIYSVDAATLASANGVTAENPLYVGQTLTIVGVAPPPVEAIPPTAEPASTIRSFPVTHSSRLRRSTVRRSLSWPLPTVFPTRR